MSSRTRLAVLAAALAAVAGPAAGQNVTLRPAAPPAGALTPPAACAKEANDWSRAQTAPALDAYRKANDSNRTALLNAYAAAANAASTGAQKMAAECAARFDPATIPATQLYDLINLYALARDTTNARVATDRLLADASLPPRLRGQALLLGMNREATRDPSHFGIIPAAEDFAAKIDALPDSLADLKLQAHRSMLGRYEYLDVAAGLEHHATALIALGRTLHSPSDMITGYESLARSFADRLQSDSALRILDAGEKELGAPATARFKDFRDRYALIGTPAPTVTARYWINPDSKGVAVPAKGKVMLVEFTAHWCGPCKNSYPGLRALSERLKGKPFTGLMVTQLYGYIGTRRNLSPDEEVAADREYFGTEHALPFPVAINAQVHPEPGKPFVQPQPDTDYRVGGIPQIMIIDQHGIIRQIVTGWDQGNTDRFEKFINQLLSETP